MKIKKGDKVLIITGKNRGQKGTVLAVDSEKERVLVEKANIITKHVKKTREHAGERIETEAPIHVSNVMVIDPETDKPTRVRYEIPKQGKKYRVAVKGGSHLDKTFHKS